MRSIGYGVLMGVLVWGCQNSAEPACADRAKEIEALERRLFSSGGEVGQETRSELMQAYAEFANRCHEHEATPEMLFRRADLLRSAGRFQEAMTQLRDVHDHYADFDKRAISAFLVGFIAENELNDREQAKKTYEQVIELHPDSEAAVWARQSLQQLNSVH